MRILQITANLEYGGLERLAVSLGRQQLEHGHEAAICCINQEGALAHEARAAGISVSAFNKAPGFSPRIIFGLARRMREENIDIVHTHNGVVHHYGAAAARLASVPVVVNTRHGFGDREWRGKRERLYRSVLRWTDAVVFVSEELEREFLARGGVTPVKSRVIANGIDFDRFARLRARPGCFGSRLRIGTVGRLVPVKDHATLIAAFARIASEFPQAELHIVGDGPEKPRIAALVAAYGLWDRVVLHGFSNATANFLSGLDVFVLSSLSEGLPLAVLEAMAAGLPIVSTRLAGVMQVAEEGRAGFYAEPGDSAGLANAVIALVRSGRMAEIGQAAHEAAALYGAGTTWKQYEAVFNSILDRKRGGAATSAPIPRTKCA